MLTAEQFRSRFEYQPETGEFIRKVSGAGHWAGEIAGHRRFDGRMIVCGLLASRLAWLWMTGAWPEDEIDHKDNDPSNNRWENLRPAKRFENCRNIRKPKNNTTGFKGVYRNRGKFRAQISVNDKAVHLGVFDTAEDAYLAYCVAADRYHGEFARVA